jgi:hypothetical protein
MEYIEDKVEIEEVLESMPVPKNKRGELRHKIKTALFMYAPEELIKLAEKHKIIPKKKIQNPDKIVVPGISVIDLLVMRLIIDAIQGDNTASKLIMEHGFGRPDLNVNYSNMDDPDEEDEIPMTTEEKIETLRAIRLKNIEGSVIDSED